MTHRLSPVAVSWGPSPAVVLGPLSAGAPAVAGRGLEAQVP